MLIGQFQSKLTDKNRIAVPKKIREELGDVLVLAKWYESCLVLVSQQGWEKLLDRFTKTHGKIVSPVRNIDRFVLGSAFEIELDSQGRFVLPDVLQEHADIKEEVVFIGLRDRVEVWSKENWNELENVAEKKAAEAIEKLV